MKKPLAWSYSRINTFKSCPKKYYHLNVKRDVKDKGNAATYYGNEVHRAAEHYIKEGTPIPPKFKFLQRPLDVIIKIEGEKHCEIRMGIAKEEEDYSPTTFFGDDV